LSQSAVVANDLRAKAEEAQREANRRAAESRELLIQQYVANGVRLMEEGDAISAMPWLVEAARQDTTDGAQQPGHRVRLATLLRHCPKLVQMFFHEGIVYYAQFSPDGRRLLTASNDGTARVWDLKTGEAIGGPLVHRATVKRAAF